MITFEQAVEMVNQWRTLNYKLESAVRGSSFNAPFVSAKRAKEIEIEMDTIYDCIYYETEFAYLFDEDEEIEIAGFRG